VSICQSRSVSCRFVPVAWNSETVNAVSFRFVLFCLRQILFCFVSQLVVLRLISFSDLYRVLSFRGFRFVSFRSGGDLVNGDYSTEGVTNPKFAIAQIDAPAPTLSKIVAICIGIAP